MSFDIYEASVPQFIRVMGNLDRLLDKAAAYCGARKIEPSVLLRARLFPDMFDFTRQVQIACDFAKGCGGRLAGVEVPKHEDNEASIAELKARIAKVVAYLSGLPREAFSAAESRQISFPMRERTLELPGGAYLLQLVLPNFYFHAATAYDILRHNGVEVSKRDFVGAL